MSAKGEEGQTMDSNLADRFIDKTVLTFDVYGTLIDWEAGLFSALSPILLAYGCSLSADAALELYVRHEADLEAGPYLTYREVLAETLRRIGADLCFEPNPAELEAFSHTVGDWPAFADSAATLQRLKQRFRLAVITNCDDELFAVSNRKLGVDFDYVITAQQARSYKPSLNNFHVAFGRIGVPRHEILHVAQSLFYDLVPASILGLESIWINRRDRRPGLGATSDARATPDAQFPDMASFATAIGCK